MHTNPFTDVGYDLQALKNELQQKADKHEIHSLRSTLDRMEHSLREACSDIASLRHRCEVLEESCQELVREYQIANSRFGVGA